MAGKRQRFGRVKVRIDELQQPGIIDFAKLLKESAPADEPDAARAPFQTKEVGMGLVVDDSVPGEDMSDDEDNRGVGKKGRGGRGIYEDIIAKWSSLSAPDAGNGSDEEGDGSGGGLSDGDDAPDSGAAYVSLHRPGFLHGFPAVLPTTLLLLDANVRNVRNVVQMITNMMMASSTTRS